MKFLIELFTTEIDFTCSVSESIPPPFDVLLKLAIRSCTRERPEAGKMSSSSPSINADSSLFNLT